MNLQMSLKKQWFEMTKAGIKREDYRSVSPYWCARLLLYQGGKKPMSLQNHFKTKFDLFIESNNYDQSFSWIDGFLFYDMFTEMGVLKPSPEQKKIAWDKAKENWKEWYTPTENNPQPTKLRFINQSKHLLFQEFILKMESDLELSDRVLKHLGL